MAPNLVGDYAGSWTQELLIDDQPTFNGVPTAPLSSPCDQGLIGGAPRSTLAISDGRIEASGAISFRFSEDPRVGLSGNGCTVTVIDAFTGICAASTISASRREAYDCTVADGHRYALTTRLVATRR